MKARGPEICASRYSGRAMTSHVGSQACYKSVTGIARNPSANG